MELRRFEPTAVVLRCFLELKLEVWPDCLLTRSHCTDGETEAQMEE